MKDTVEGRYKGKVSEAHARGYAEQGDVPAGEKAEEQKQFDAVNAKPACIPPCR